MIAQFIWIHRTNVVLQVGTLGAVIILVIIFLISVLLTVPIFLKVKFLSMAELLVRALNQTFHKIHPFEGRRFQYSNELPKQIRQDLSVHRGINDFFL